MRSKLLLFALLTSSCTLWAQTHYTCSTTAGTVINSSNYKMVSCESYSSNGSNASSVSGTATVNPTTTNWAIMFLGQCAIGGGDACAAVGGGQGSLFGEDSLGNVARGTVNTSGVDVFFNTGQPFSTIGMHYGGCNWVGGTISINSSNYTVSKCISLSHLKISTSAGTQTNVAYAGPGPGGTDTGVSKVSTQAVVWWVISTGGADTFSAGDCLVFTNPTTCGTFATATSAMSLSYVEISNSSGLGSIDLGACFLANCGSSYQESGTNSFTQMRPTLGFSNELVLLGMNNGSGATTTSPSPWLPLVMGRANTVETQAVVESSAGQFAAEMNNGGDNVGMGNVIAITQSGTGSGTSVPSVALLNQQCAKNSSAAGCIILSGSAGLSFGMPLTPGSIVGICGVNVGGSGATVADTAGLLFTDWGPGYVPFSGSSAFGHCWYALNTTSTLEDTFTVSPTTGTWWIAGELSGLATSSPVDGGLKTGYCFNPNATSGAAGAVNTCATSGSDGPMTPPTSNDTILAFYTPFNGPPAGVQSGYSEVMQGIFGAGSLFFKTCSGSCGSPNPTATDGNGSGDALAGEAVALKAFVAALVSHRGWVIQ